MTNEEKVKVFIKTILEPVEDKPGYVWVNKRNLQMISIETLQKTLLKHYQAVNKESKRGKNEN